MKTRKYIVGIALLAIWAIPSFSQVSNDNEDGVNKIDSRWAQKDYVPGQVLVKFKDSQRIQVNSSRGMFKSTNVSRLTSVLQKYGVDEMEKSLIVNCAEPRPLMVKRFKSATSRSSIVFNSMRLTRMKSSQ